MPTVPSYGGQQVQQAPIRGGRRSAAPSETSLGAPLGDLAAGVGTSGFAQAMQQARDQADEARLLSLDRQVSDFELGLDAPDGSFTTAKGEQALGLIDRVSTDYDALVGKLGEGLNERQRSAFDRLAAGRRDAILRRATSITTREYEAFTAAETRASLTNSQQLAVANADDPGRVRQEVERQKVIIDGIPGIGPEQREAMVAESLSRTHVGVIDRMLAQGQDRTAADYWQQARAEIAGDQHARIERALEEGSTRGRSQQEADAILEFADTLTEAVEEVKKISDPALRDATEQRVRAGWDLRKAAEREAHEDALRGAYDLVDTRLTVDAIPPGTWVEFTGAERSALQSYAARKREGSPVETDMATWYTLVDRATKDPAGFAAENLLKHRNRLGDAEFKELARMQVAIRTDEPNEPALREASIQADIFDAVVRRAGIDQEDKDLLGQLRYAVNQQIDLEQRSPGNQGKILTRERKEEIMRGIVGRRVVIDTRFRSDQERLAVVVKPDEVENAYVPMARIPTPSMEEWVNVIRSTFPSAQHLSKEEIARTYARRIERAHAAAMLGLGAEEERKRLEGQ